MRSCWPITQYYIERIKYIIMSVLSSRGCSPCPTTYPCFPFCDNVDRFVGCFIHFDRSTRREEIPLVGLVLVSWGMQYICATVSEVQPGQQSMGVILLWLANNKSVFLRITWDPPKDVEISVKDDCCCYFVCLPVQCLNFKGHRLFHCCLIFRALCGKIGPRVAVGLGRTIIPALPSADWCNATRAYYCLQKVI